MFRLNFLIIFLYISITKCSRNGQIEKNFKNQPFRDQEVKPDFPEVIKIGGIFALEDKESQNALKSAVEHINYKRILPRTQIIVEIEEIEQSSDKIPFDIVEQKICSLLSSGIAGIFGPSNFPEISSHLQSICDAFEIPYIEIKWDFILRKDNYLINLHPNPVALNQALSDLVLSWGWKEFIILYDDEKSLYRIESLIKLSHPPDMNVVLIRLPQEENDFRPILMEIMEDLPDYRNFVIDLEITERIPILLKQAQQVGMIIHTYSYIFTTLDIQSLDLEDFQYGHMNLTAFRLVDPDKPEVQNVLEQWKTMQESQGKIDDSQEPKDEDQVTEPQDPEPLYEPTLNTQTAMFYDGVELFVRGLQGLSRLEVNPIDCKSDHVFEDGYSIINYMKMVQFNGLTGPIQFDPLGYRTDVILDVVQITPKGFRKIGRWDSKLAAKLYWKPSVEDGEEHHKDSAKKGTKNKNDLQNRTLIITTILNDPFCMLTLSEEPLEGNDRYEGFAIDLVKKLSVKLGFQYIIKPVADGSYGSFNKKTGQWNGMIKEVMDGVADIAVADLTINKERQKAIDFSMPFMNLGISILFAAPKAKPPSLMSFMAPLSFEVWMLMCIAIMGVSLTMYFVTKVTPYEWDPCPNHPCIDEPEEMENNWTFFNCFYFVMGTILGQGADIAPRVASSRIVAGSWWFFTLIMVSSYTANLATFLIVQDLEEIIKTVDDLPKQSRDSLFESRRLVWDSMVKMKPSPFISNNKEGVERVKNSTYAFFMESTVIEYNIERICGLSQVGGLLDSKGYGIGVKKNSTLKQWFSSGILNLQEQGALDELKRKWWKEERKDGEDCGALSEGDVTALKLANVGGCFVVIVLGSIVAFFIGFCELAIKARDTMNEYKLGYFQALQMEIRAIKFKGDSKPASILEALGIDEEPEPDEENGQEKDD